MRARLTLAVAAVSALGLMLSACSLAGPNPRTFTTAAEQKPVKPDATAIEQASQACKSRAAPEGHQVGARHPLPHAAWRGR